MTSNTFTSSGSVSRRRAALLLMEDPAEIQRVAVAHDPSDFIYGVGGGFKQYLGVGHAQRGQVLHRSFPGILFEVADEVADTHSS